MSRNALIYLQNWLDSANRKPVVVRGARQVGKTYTVRELAKITGRQLIEINFEKHINIASLFSSNDPKKIVANLEARFSISIDTNQAILFLDEIQSEPDMLAKLRWFAEDMPQLAVVAAGSLLDFLLDEHQFSMPVGRITYMYMNPLSFDEFLVMTDHHPLMDYLKQYSFGDEFPESIHDQLMDLFREYVLIGGMPAAVYAWKQERSLMAAQQIHLDLLSSYRDDFSKYAGKMSVSRLDDILLAVPRLLGRKFVYSHVNKDVKSSALKQSLDLLVKARVCQKVQASAANGVPLLSEVNPKNTKVVFLDVGLLASQLGLALHELRLQEDINLVNNGAISEQVVGQLLQTIEPFYVEPSLCYWTRDQRNSNAELDYVIQHGNQVVPVEVKSGKSGTLKSLHLFMAEKKLPLAVRVNSDLPSQVRVTNGSSAYILGSLPFYMMGQLHRLLKELQ